MPDLEVEEIVAQLERRGFECWFDPGGDIPPGWNCRRGDQGDGDYLDVGIAADETGAIDDISASRTIQVGPDEGADPALLDRDAAASFHANVIALIVPEDLRPTEAGVFAGIQRNFPVELGDGWFLGFDRNSISRTIRVVYSSDES